MVRQAVNDLLNLGTFPASKDVCPEMIRKQEELLRNISSPISDDEARLLVRLFGPDDYYGLAWTVLHLIEHSPNWPLADCLTDEGNEWIDRLRLRLTKKMSSNPNECQ